jgi:DegV family protein with EDD domain
MDMIGIITDSTCDIPENLVEQYGINVLPLNINWGNEQFKDRIDLSPSQFYSRLITDPVMPKTSQPTIPDFQNIYESVLNRGADELVVITISSAMSGTYNAARAACEAFKVPISVVDSKGPTMTLGWQVLAAARARAAGAGTQSILQKLDEVRGKLVQLVGMETMKYLKTGGRIGGAASWAGTLLHVKPLVSINHQTGLVEPVGLNRTTSGLVDHLYRKFFEMVKSVKNLRIAVLHGNVPEKAEAIAEKIRAEYQPVELLVNITGPVLGINTGPGALALCGYPDD